MPVEHAVWKIGEKPDRLEECILDNELELEDIVFQDMSVLNDQWLLIGRQVQTAYNKRIDLLAIDASGSIIIIELKRNKTPREVVAQAIDYASWVKNLDATDIANVFETFCETYLSESKSLDQAFAEKFGAKLDEDDLNSSHQIVVVAAELDSSTERIVLYLNEYSIPLNAVFFKVFRDGENRYLSRAWFIDPAQTQAQATTPRSAEPWNGEYYVSFGTGIDRDWEDARKYGFISGGGGRWYSQTLTQLQKGDRVWVNIPKTGYVGVGLVEESAVKVDEFKVATEQGELPILDAPIKAKYHRDHVDDEDKAEYFVRVKWIRDVPTKEAKSELGFFGNQNTVCKPTTPKWNHTVERLKSLFQVD